MYEMSKFREIQCIRWIKKPKTLFYPRVRSPSPIDSYPITCFSLQAYYFDRSDVALRGLYKYFKKASDEEREHAMKFLTYQNKRGGDIVLMDIQAPTRRDWNSAKDAMTEALQLEKKVNQVCVCGVIARNRYRRELKEKKAVYKNFFYTLENVKF